MRGRRRLITPLAVALVGLTTVGLIIWGLTQGSSMFSPGGLNSTPGTVAAQSAGSASAGSAQAAASALQPTAGAAQSATASNQSATVGMVSLGGVSTHAAIGDDCAACHAVPFSADTMAAKCLACHKDVQQQMAARSDLHGRLLNNGWDGTCGGCHTEHHGAAGALTVLDKSFPHQVTGYSLQAHRELDCERCHVSALTTFDSKTCIECHERRRGSFMTEHIATFGSQCVPCHDGVDRYGENFDHNKLVFPLTGGHAALACSTCHKNATSVEALKQTPQDCYSCHAKDDAHKGQFGTDCAGCHTTAGWAQATFDHSKTTFPLTGAHSGITCTQCHKSGDFTTALSADCASCHSEPAFHAGAFGSQGTLCASCHNTAAWTPATFDLDHTVFPLNHGSQERIPTCKTCHTETVKTYTCLGCHEHSPDRVVAEHEGQTLIQLQDCVRCHQGGRGGD